MSAEFTIRWVLTHEPIALFEEAARRFVELVREESGGRIDVQVFTPSEYGRGARAKPLDVARQVAAGELEMAQTYTTVLGQLHEGLWSLDLPLLFESHAHAAEVLDGPIGRELLEGLVPSGIRGLAFTYSGGYRIVSSTERALAAVDDLRDLKVRTSSNPVVTDLMETLGARPHPAALWDVPALTEAGAIEAAESTWPRYWDMGHWEHQPVVSETGHSLFLTAIVVSEAFYAGLPADLQDVLQRAARQVAVLERAKSVADGEKARAAALQRGIRVVERSDALLEGLRTAAAGVHERFTDRFGADLLERIRAAALTAAE